MRNYMPDLLLTVDFGILGLAFNSTNNLALNSIYVMVWMSGNTIDVLEMARPTVP